MSNQKTRSQRRILALALSIFLLPFWVPAAQADDKELNFKVYSPEAGNSTDAANGQNNGVSDTPSLRPEASVQPEGKSATSADAQASVDSQTQLQASPGQPSPAQSSAVSADSSSSSESTGSANINSGTSTTPNLNKEIPLNDVGAANGAPKDSDKQNTPQNTLPESAQSPDSSKLKPEAATSDTSSATSSAVSSDTQGSNTTDDKQASSGSTAESTAPALKDEKATAAATTDNTDSDSDEAKSESGKGKVLKGYVRVVPTGTKIPIIMDTAVDSDTSQEGDEFSARTAEDLTIDGNTAVPAGSIIRGRIASINSPKHLDRNGSVALKFDTVTTPDNRQIPLVANLVARGGVVHAKRGLRDIAMDTGIAALPAVVGVGIGAVAGNSSSSSHLGVGGGALIGAGIGVAVGVAVLLAKKGKKVDVRPGDELKIELAEDLHMPTM
jgi:hypothetical protein